MRIAIATVQVPFIQGGAEFLAAGLQRALRRHGHETEIVTTPFRFAPSSEVLRSMALWQTENFEYCNGYEIDRVICLKFPTYVCMHPRKVLWLLHQHRGVYELWNEKENHSADDLRVRDETMALDRDALGGIAKRYTISRNVASRLSRYNGISAESLYHPPALAERLFCKPDEMFIFYPSRLEQLKRQTLLIEAMRHVRTPVTAVIAGTGGQEATCRALIEQHGLGDRVRLLGQIDAERMLACYALCLGVFFGPYDEDYGYVTLEAMLAGKPVITCRDSGGPLEFVRDGETGAITEPTPQAIADAIDRLAADRTRARDMGQAGLAHYRSSGISWDTVVERLTAA